MTDTARVLLTAGILSAVGLSAFAWRLTRPGRPAHEYLIDQLTLSQWAALLLAATGAAGIGLAVGAAATPQSLVEVLAGIVTMAAGVLVLRREPRQALLIAGVLLVLHALFDVAHRPALLTTEVVPQWWAVGTALYDVHIAALCLLSRRA